MTAWAVARALAGLVVLELRAAARRRAAARAHATSAVAAVRVVCDVCGARVPADATSRAAHARRHGP